MKLKTLIVVTLGHESFGAFHITAIAEKILPISFLLCFVTFASCSLLTIGRLQYS